ncbi:MAG: hypothetical protein GEV11_04490 [Streptosporangiales bacterium]|nr:hypothetical protein [Streptosporangiales bacterium]
MTDVVAGFGYLVAGVRWVAWHPRLWLFGLIPALITLAGYVLGLVMLIGYADDLATWATPFADGWAEPWRTAVHWAAGLMVVGAAALLAVLTFTAVTLIVGGPFYEALAGRVEEAEGGEAPESGLSMARELAVSIRESVVTVLLAVMFAVVLFGLGFVPLFGQTVIPVIGACVSGFFLAVELTAVTLLRRGVRLRTRIRLLRGRLGLTLGFGVPLFLTFLVPFVAVVLMPGAVAGATLLARDRLVSQP